MRYVRFQIVSFVSHQLSSVTFIGLDGKKKVKENLKKIQIYGIFEGSEHLRIKYGQKL
jgi:hypothetical protein